MFLHDARLTSNGAAGRRRPAKRGQALSPEALLDFCQTRMPHFAVPRYVEFLAALPKTPTAKVQKVTLHRSGVSDATWDREAAGYRLRR